MDAGSDTGECVAPDVKSGRATAASGTGTGLRTDRDCEPLAPAGGDAAADGDDCTGCETGTARGTVALVADNRE
jgi:hypothetical protein